MVTTFYFGKDGELVEQSDESIQRSLLTNDEEVHLLGCKSKKELVALYLEGKISYDAMQRWCNA